MVPSVLSGDRDGFTLIEVLVAVVLVAVILLGNMAALSISYKKNVKNAVMDTAVIIAQDYIEQYRATGDGTDWDESTTRQFRNFSLTYTVSIDAVEKGEFWQLTTTVSWNFAGESHSIVMESYAQQN